MAASSRPGDLVLDPYAGSGTTGVAAARLGRRWLLVDRNPAAVAIARARLAAEPGEAAARDDRGRSPSTSATRWSRCRPRGCAAVVAETARRDGRAPRAVRRRARCCRPGPRSASASSARRCRSSARWTWRSGSSGSSRGCAGMAPPPPDVRWDDAAAARRSIAGRGRVGRGGLLAGPSSRRCRRRPAAAAAARAARAPVPPRDPVQLAAGRDDRPLRGGRRLGAAPRRGRRVAARRARSSRTPRSSPRPGRRSGDPAPAAILHVGDDWAADVVGAKRAGWRAAWLAVAARRFAAPRLGARRQRGGGPGDPRPGRARDGHRAPGRLTAVPPLGPGSSPRRRRKPSRRMPAAVGRLDRMEARDRIANLGLLAAAAAGVDPGRRPRHDPRPVRRTRWPATSARS